MLNIKCFVVNLVEENCYIVNDQTNEAIMIDCGIMYDSEQKEIVDYITTNNLKLKHLVCTHSHFDHTMGCSRIYDIYGLKPQMHSADTELYINLQQQIQSILGRNIPKSFTNIKTVPPDKTLAEGDEVLFGTHKFNVISTPGHTPGGICFYCSEENILFSGDSLFCQSIGRTDFPGGNSHDLISSLKTKILTLSDQTMVYPGHGPTTTIKSERENNYFLR